MTTERISAERLEEIRKHHNLAWCGGIHSSWRDVDELIDEVDTLRADLDKAENANRAAQEGFVSVPVTTLTKMQLLYGIHSDPPCNRCHDLKTEIDDLLDGGKEK